MPTAPRSVADALAGYFVNRATHGGTTAAVTAALREAILDGALLPEDWLREDELARIFSVSRTPVREALSHLVDEGLARKAVHLGTVVSTLTLEDVLALYVVREDLEGLAARLAADRATPQLLVELDAIGQQMKAAAEKSDADRLARLNLDWHGRLRAAASNTYLDRFLGQVEQAVRRLPISTFAEPDRARAVLAEHEAVVDAIRAGDGEAAQSAARQHMRRAREARLAKLLHSR
jgi:DNA-binding GntR family transcriptional regulator